MIYNLFIENIPLEIQMRQCRDALLLASDWTQTLDAPVNRQAWAEYRQQLRDFPKNWTPSEVVEFPDTPIG